MGEMTDVKFYWPQEKLLKFTVSRKSSMWLSRNASSITNQHNTVWRGKPVGPFCDLPGQRNHLRPFANAIPPKTLTVGTFICCTNKSLTRSRGRLPGSNLTPRFALQRVLQESCHTCETATKITARFFLSSLFAKHIHTNETYGQTADTLLNLFSRP